MIYHKVKKSNEERVKDYDSFYATTDAAYVDLKE